MYCLIIQSEKSKLGDFTCLEISEISISSLIAGQCWRRKLDGFPSAFLQLLMTYLKWLQSISLTWTTEAATCVSEYYSISSDDDCDIDFLHFRWLHYTWEMETRGSDFQSDEPDYQNETQRPQYGKGTSSGRMQTTSIKIFLQPSSGLDSRTLITLKGKSRNFYFQKLFVINFISRL